MAIGDTIFRSTSLWKRLVGNTTTTRKFLRQTGTGSASAAPVWDQPADADLTVTDITTNNVTTSAHGFVPKAPGGTTLFLRADASWAVPSGGGGGTNALLDGSNHTDTTASSVTKGDLVVGNSTPAWDDLAVGTNGQVLTADSAEAVGMKWATPSAAGGPITVRKTSDQTVNNSTTLVDDTELLFAVAANSVYDFELLLLHGAISNVPDFKLHFTVPSGATMRWGAAAGSLPSFDGTGQATSPTTLNTESTTLIMGSTVDTSSQVYGAIYRGTVVTSATSGTVTLQWAQNTATSGNNSIKTNSRIRYEDIT